MQEKKRIQIFDIAKGISIILMTITHCSFKKIYPSLVDFNNFVMIFKMPMFIFISGYLLSDRLNFRAFSHHKLDGLIKPLIGFLLSLTLLKIILYVLITDAITPDGVMKYVNALASVFVYWDLGFVNNVLWFVAALFLSQIAFKVMLACKDSRVPYNYFMVIILLLALLTLISIESKFYYLGYIPIFFVYLLLGYVFKRISNRFLNGTSFFYGSKMLLFPVLFLISLIILKYSNINMKLNIYEFEYNYHYLIIVSLFGVFTVLYICRFIEKIPILSAFLVYCSKASFFILAYHIFVLDVYEALFDLESDTPLFYTFLFFLNIVICCLIYMLVKKIPFVRIFFYPIKTIALKTSEKNVLKSKYFNRFVPKDVLVMMH